ncbi:MAG: DUF1549 domain-containing protein [Verrucomicrobiales bacterium]|nr:DUF1549 domain-containing protein [Verrucomicrobiales bacterium]
MPFLAASINAANPAAKGSAETVDLNAAAKEVDRLVNAVLKENGVAPNPPIDDATFVRRAYLDIAGRIPTIEEAENFHGSTYERKREQLIRDLLESDGHVSHAFNFWADILRINSGLGNNARQAEAAYQLWVRDAIEKNMPYDDFVRELIAARGQIWDNGAVGYYIRDRGMPLDNMSNTVRVFLGTRLECAQCHNHPFDDWTQMDYFHMAAFSYGMDARRYDSENRKALAEYQRNERKAVLENAVKIEKFPQITNERTLKSFVSNKNYERSLERLGITDAQFRKHAKRSIDAYAAYEHENRGMRDAINELYNPLQYIQTSEVEKTLKLPHDYQYDDAKPNDPVKPRTMFGADIDLESIDDSMIDAYAGWITSSENPTFTRVIANRLWKRVFGHGIFEPVDELTDNTAVTNPDLLAYLEGLMRDLDYDMRAFQEVLYRTNAYQREVNREELVLGMPYYFEGPVLRRMTAEQIWDSIVALALPEADGYRPRLKAQLESVERVRQVYNALEGRSEEDFIAMVKEVASTYDKSRPQQDKIREQMYTARESGDEVKYRKLQNELNGLRREARNVVESIGYNHIGKKVDGDDLLAAMGMSEMSMTMQGGEMMASGDEGAVLTKLPKPAYPDPPEGLDRKQEKVWKDRLKGEYRVYTSLVSQMARASELESPARRGHFLREFGQSDREVIENASYSASVPQALNLLNGTISEALTNQFAVFGRRIHSAGDTKEKTRMIFQAMLTREPTDREMEIALNQIGKNGDSAYEGLVWALLNTQQFMFVQ